MRGEKVRLYAVGKENIPYIVMWRNDQEILGNLFSFLPLNNEQEEIWYENYIKDPTRQYFMIQENGTINSIGVIGLDNIDYRNGTASLSIIIGDRKYRGKGYGTDALLTLLRFAFNEMNIRKIRANTFTENKAALRLYRKVGFVIEGCLKEEIFKHGEYKDVIILSIFK